MEPNRFLIVGGNPFGHSFTGLRVVATANTREQVKTLWNAHYDKCGGLLIVVDTQQPFVDFWNKETLVTKNSSSAILCGHANECSSNPCTCKQDCYCRQTGNTCFNK